MENPGEDPKIRAFNRNEADYNESYNSWEEIQRIPIKRYFLFITFLNAIFIF